MPPHQLDDDGLPQVRIALAGLGTVGTAVIQFLRQDKERYREGLGLDLRLISIFDRSYQRKDASWTGSDVKVTDRLDEFLETPADIVVEVLGGAEPAHQIICSSLEEQKAVVTANKLLMARSGAEYFDLVEKHDAFMGFEASVAGGIPILRALRRSLFADRIVRVQGILNGTCNFVLTEMGSTGREFQEVLAQAQALGYAEADPFLDVSGRDTTDKLSILSALAFGQWVSPERIPTRGIADIWPIDFLYARKLNSSIKLLGTAESHAGRLNLRVSPFLVSDHLALSKISGVLNAVEVTGERSGSYVFSGRGAGGNPTAMSVVADILNAALWKHGRIRFHSHRIVADQGDISYSRSQSEAAERYPFYLRFFVKDQPGIIAALARILADRKINIDSVLQEHWPDKSRLPFIITVEPTPFSTMQDAFEEMKQLDFNKVPPLVLPMLFSFIH
ncbi:MAG: homoserine dehydrogenase [Acidobacteriota bacterium]